MYAVSNGKCFELDFSKENRDWQPIRLNQILIKNGQVEIGFFADGLLVHTLMLMMCL
jgi:hypothetical protein